MDYYDFIKSFNGEGFSLLINLAEGGEFTGGLGMISHKKSLINIFGHKHEIKYFIKNFDTFHNQQT